MLGDDGVAPGIPAWVKISAVVGAILVLALVAVLFVSGGDHGPSWHKMGERDVGQQNGQGAT